MFVPSMSCRVLADLGKNLFTGPICFLAISDPFYIGTGDLQSLLVVCVFGRGRRLWDSIAFACLGPPCLVMLQDLLDFANEACFLIGIIPI